jgi:hypothetical protein
LLTNNFADRDRFLTIENGTSSNAPTNSTSGSARTGRAMTPTCFTMGPPTPMAICMPGMR